MQLFSVNDQSINFAIEFKYIPDLIPSLRCLIAQPPWNTPGYKECTLEEASKCALSAYMEYGE